MILACRYHIAHSNQCGFLCHFTINSNDPRAISGLSRGIAERYLAVVMGNRILMFLVAVIARRIVRISVFLFSLALSFSVGADVIVLKNKRAYAGIIERLTSQSVQLFDGNLRRVVAIGDIKEVIRERHDTSWVIVGDLMAQQRDWDAAVAAYRRALEDTQQPDVLLGRLEYLRALRYETPGSKQANHLLETGRHREAVAALFAVAKNAKESAQQHYWIGRLSRAYAGLSSKRASSGTATIDPYLAYALAIAPDCAPAHSLLGERLEAVSLADLARAEFGLALDLDPTDRRARQRLAAQGESWTYDSKQNNRSGLRDWIESQPPLPLSSEAPLTTPALATALGRRVERPVGLLLAAYLVEPTIGLAYNGELPYPGYDKLIGAILKETTNTTGTSPYDQEIIRTGIAIRIDPRFVRAIAKVRSEYKEDYVSPDGARGLVPMRRPQWETAARLLGQDWSFEKDSADWRKSVGLVFPYLDWLRREVVRPYVGNRLDRLERVHGNL